MSVVASSRSVHHARWRAMGADAHVLVVGPVPGHAELARRLVDDLEHRWSRFVATSEISQLSARAGTWVRVSEPTRLLVARAVDAWRVTGGSFDPTVLTALVAAGYDRSFELLDAAGEAGRTGTTRLAAPGCTDIELDGDRVRLPGGTGFDPGGIGKGLAADLVVAELLDAGARGACVNLGGDLRVAGESPTGDGWTVGIEHPDAARPLTFVGLHRGAVATSTTLRRVWHRDGRRAHHLIDPATGNPSDTDVTLASVVAPDAWQAEVLAKSVLLRGSAHAFDCIDTRDVAALAVTVTGEVRHTANWLDFTAGEPVADRLCADLTSTAPPAPA